jgi:hypothetical protein
VSPARYELGFYIPEDGIHHSDRRESLNTQVCKELLASALQCMRNGLAFVGRLTRVPAVKRLAANEASELRHRARAVYLRQGE